MNDTPAHERFDNRKHNKGEQASSPLKDKIEWGKEPSLIVHCECGNEYTLHLYTVCPQCFRWPKSEKSS